MRRHHYLEFCCSKHFPTLPKGPAFHLIKCSIWSKRIQKGSVVGSPRRSSGKHFSPRWVSIAIGPDECGPCVNFSSNETLYSSAAEAWGIRSYDCFAHHQKRHFLVLECLSDYDGDYDGRSSQGRSAWEQLWSSYTCVSDYSQRVDGLAIHLSSNCGLDLFGCSCD